MPAILPDNIPLETEGTPVSEVMIKDPYTCPSTATIGDVISLLADYQVSSLPVVDADRRLVGFISDGDIMGAIAQHRAHSIFTGGDASMLYFDDQKLDDRIAELKGRNVMDFASRKVVCTRPDQSIARVAATLSRKKFKKLPVVDDEGNLVGIVRRAAIIKYLFKIMFG